MIGQVSIVVLRLRDHIKVIACLGALLLLSACPASGPDCVLADDWGQNEVSYVAVSPATEFNDANLSVLGGENLEMKVAGAIDLCPDQKLLDEASVPAISPKVSTWQTSGVSVNKDDYFTIFVRDQNNEETPNSSSYVDQRGQTLRGGKGLYALILPPGEVPSAHHNSEWFWKDPTIGKDPEFFELYENDPENGKPLGSGAGGFSGVAPITGTIWFRYARTARDGDNTRQVSNSGDWDERWSPWKGKYAWGDTACLVTCNPAAFIPACYAIGGGATVLFGYEPYTMCVIPREEVCRKKKQLPDMANCKWSPIDHWVNESYELNSNGYEINISVGCPGDKGKYLEMLIVQPTDVVTTEEPIFSPRGCTPGSVGCRPQVDQNGRPLTVPKSRIKENANAFSMSMYYANNGQFNTKAEYNGVVPRTGHVWFRVVDTKIKATDALATPFGCNIPGHPNFVEPANDPSGCVQAVNPSANSQDTMCYNDYIDDGTGNRERNAQLCGMSLLEQVTQQLAEQHGNNPSQYTYEPACGFKNPDCLPPKGYTGHADNIGQYTVMVKTTKVDDAFSKGLNAIIKPVKAILYGTCRAEEGINEVACNARYGDESWKPGITKRMYTKLIGDTDGGGGNVFVKFVRVMLILFIVIYAMRFMLGMTEDTQKEFLWNLLRVAVIQQMLSPTSWEFFNSYLFVVFTDGVNGLISAIAGQFMAGGSTELVDPITGQVLVDQAGSPLRINVENPFSFVDHTISRFFSQETWIKLAGLLFYSPVGWLYIILMCVGMWYFIMAIIIALTIYLLAMIGIALQIIVAPIFITLVLFKKTRVYFNNWLRFLLSFLAQPILVLTALSIFNVFVYSAIYTLLHYTVCWQCIFDISLNFGKLGDLKFCLFKFYWPVSGSTINSIPVQFFFILIFIIMCNAMYTFNEWMVKLAAEITTGTSKINLFAAAKETLANMVDVTASGLKNSGSLTKTVAGGVVGLMTRKGGEKDDGKKEDEDKDKDKSGGSDD